MRFGKAITVIPLILSFALISCESKSQEQGLYCEVDLSSPGSGRIQIIRSDENPIVPSADKFQVLWHIPGSSNSIDLVAVYGSALGDLSNVKVARARFVPPVSAIATAYSAHVVISESEHYSFNNSDFRAGTDVGDLLINRQSESGTAILNAINTNRAFTITLSNNNEVFARVRIDPTNVKGRDFIFSQARQIVINGDPKYCRPQPKAHWTPYHRQNVKLP